MLHTSYKVTNIAASSGYGVKPHKWKYVVVPDLFKIRLIIESHR